MKEIIRRLTPSILRSFIIRLGNFYGCRCPFVFPSQEAAFHTLKSLGWSPRTSIDVGAYHGNWALMLRTIFPEAKILMVEGQEEKKELLKEMVLGSSGYLEYEIALLGASDGLEVDFIEMETGSSVFEEASPYPRKKIKRKLTTLDILLTHHSDFKHAQLLKLDTQGYELEVMKGSVNLLSRTEVVLLEVSLIPINNGAPIFSEVVEFMAFHHFILFDFCSQIRRKDGVLWQTDLLFIREGAVPNLEPKLNKENWR